MSRRSGIIVLVAGVTLVLATAVLRHRLDPQSGGLVAAVEKHTQESVSNSVTTPQPLSANIPSEHPIATASDTKNEDNSVPAPTKAEKQKEEAIRYVWAGLIDELGLDTERATQLYNIFLDPDVVDPNAKLREELGEAGYQAYLNYLPTLPLRQEIVPFKVELAQKGIPLDRETEKSLIQIVREELPPRLAGKAVNVVDLQAQEEQARERIYKRASGMFSGEALSVFKAWGTGKG